MTLQMLTVKYNGGLRTITTHPTGKVFETAASRDKCKELDAYTPVDMVCTGLAACVLTMLADAGEVHGFNVNGSYIEVTKEMSSKPRRIAEINLKIHMPGHSYSEKERQILEQAAKGCPVGHSLHPDIKVTHTFHF